MTRARWLFSLALLGGCGSSPTAPTPSHDPAAARIVTEDIPRFWTAFDRIQSAADTAPLRGYLDAGTAGLKDFTQLRWKNAATLTGMVWPRRAYYQSVRANSQSAAGTEAELRRIFRALAARLDDAVFPDVYFVIGGMATGGTTSAHGLLIGTEMFSRAPDSPVGALTPWEQSVIRGIEILPAIVAHELIHYQQRYGRQPVTLLEQSIREGSADFLGRMLAGRTINETLETYGLAHEAELWAEFQAAMQGSDLSRWLYNGGAVVPGGRPADLGYFIGSRITEAYYLARGGSDEAVQEILRIGDFTAFLAASGYHGAPPFLRAGTPPAVGTANPGGPAGRP